MGGLGNLQVFLQFRLKILGIKTSTFCLGVQLPSHLNIHQLYDYFGAKKLILMYILCILHIYELLPYTYVLYKHDTLLHIQTHALKTK